MSFDGHGTGGARRETDLGEQRGDALVGHAETQLLANFGASGSQVRSSGWSRLSTGPWKRALIALTRSFGRVRAAVVDRATVVDRRRAGRDRTRDHARQIRRRLEHERLAEPDVAVLDDLAAVRPGQELHAPAVDRDVVERHPHREAVRGDARLIPVGLVLMPRGVATGGRGLEDHVRAAAGDLRFVDLEQGARDATRVREVRGLQDLGDRELRPEDLVDHPVRSVVALAVEVEAEHLRVLEDVVVDRAEPRQLVGRRDRFLDPQIAVLPERL